MLVSPRPLIPPPFGLRSPPARQESSSSSWTFPCIFMRHDTNYLPLLPLPPIISRLSKLKSAPRCEVIEKGTDPFSRTVVQFVFDMKH